MDFRPVTHSHLWLAFASTLRVVASAFSRLHRAFIRFTIARSRMAEYQRQPFGTLPPHLTVQIISSHSFCYGLVFSTNNVSLIDIGKPLNIFSGFSPSSHRT